MGRRRYLSHGGAYGVGSLPPAHERETIEGVRQIRLGGGVWMRMLLMAVALGLGMTGAGAREMLAQGPPARVFGAVTVDGATPPQGTRVEAYIAGKLCGEGVVRQLGGDIGVGYVVDVKGESLEPGCGA